jgi:UDP-GlcNAc:undecaprenyl-phosphate GlcNAc-1-phosphate transferase
MAQRGGLPVPVVAAVHVGFALFQGWLALGFESLPGNIKPLVILPPLAVQLLWLGFVAWRVRQAGLSWRAG